MYDILCVDDVPANLLVLECLFEKYESKYNIITASSRNEAIDILSTQKIDLILLDVMIPKLDGFQTAKLIKANKLTKDIPIIFLTVKRDDDTIKNAFKYGVDYLSKPYDEYELIVRVNTQLKQDDTVDDILLCADEALYKAKENGRNKVCTN
jgi:PleD family two-component response regulator